jgi:hypothetical protein
MVRVAFVIDAFFRRSASRSGRLSRAGDARGRHPLDDGHMAQGTQMTVSTGAPAGAGARARPAPGSGGRKRVARMMVLAWATQLFWDRRFRVGVIMAAITLGALRGLAREGAARSAAWDQRSRARSLEAEAKKALHRGKQAVTGG